MTSISGRSLGLLILLHRCLVGGFCVGDGVVFGDGKFRSVCLSIVFYFKLFLGIDTIVVSFLSKDLLLLERYAF